MEEKQKRKRKVSLITVFLWIFLIAVMSVITLSSVRRKSALEIIDNNWNIGLVMYDRSSDTPNGAITDFTWNATSSSETKQLVMQINYNCTTGKAYNPGEIVIEIPGINEEYFRELRRKNKDYCYKWLDNNITVGADKLSDGTKNYNFSYEYNSKNNMYIFTNNKKVEENEHFEGTIQIVYDLETDFRSSLELQFKAKIKENIENTNEIITMESNICNFNYTATKTLYTLKNEISLAPKSIYQNIGNVVDEYYWIAFQFIYSKSDNSPISALDEHRGAIGADSECIREVLPEGCVIYDDNLEKIEPKENNTYYYLKTKSFATAKNKKYYIGYPKSKYNVGDEITNIAELWGRYEDEEEIQKLTEASSTVSLVDFDFEYDGKLYDIRKSNVEIYKNGIYESYIKSTNGCATSWYMNATAFYTDSLMDVEIGDDLVYITRENGSISKLNEDEYEFSYINVPVFYTYNKYTGSKGDVLSGYNYEVQVRYKGSNEYIKHTEGVTGTRSRRIILWDNIVGVKLIIKDLDKTLYPTGSNGSDGNIYVEINVHTSNCKSGFVYNFNYLQVYKKDKEGNKTLANEVNLSNYNMISSQDIAKYDMNTYGRYMQRSYSSAKIESGSFELSVEKYSKDIKNNVKKEKYETQYILYHSFSLDMFWVDKDCIIKQYDILPIGINLVSTKEEIIDEICSAKIKYDLPYNRLALKDGTKFKTLDELTNYIKNNTTVDIDYNYKNSGRTKVSVIYNLNEIDWKEYSNRKNELIVGLGTILNVEIPYDSILEYGTSYTNYVYSMWGEQEYSYTGTTLYDTGDEDILAKDIDEDGNITEKLIYCKDNLKISHAVSSNQAVIKQVRTDLTKGQFVSKTANVTAGEEYTYKLKVTTGANSLKDLIIYDTLETTYDENRKEITEGWKGEFLGVDTSYAISKGYAPKVYYSEDKNPGKLTEVPDKWKKLTGEVDKSKVKSICVDLRYKADGSEMELSSNNVVFVLVNMRAPEDDRIISSSSNMFSTNWRAKNPMGDTIDNIEGIYSNKINVIIYKEENKTKNIEGKKIWENDKYEQEYRPKSVTVKLLQDGVEYLRKEVSEESNWEYIFEDVPVYKNIELEEYEYSIEEEEIPAYETTYDGYDIINTLKMINLEGTKLWDDNDDEYNLRPEFIKVKLFDGEKLIREQWNCEWYDWKWSFYSLPEFRVDGSKIEYTIKEEVPNYYCVRIGRRSSRRI